MRTACLALLLAAAFAACGDDDERPASGAPGPDTAVFSGAAEPGGTAPALAPAPECKRLGRRLVGAAVGAAQARAEERGCTLRFAEIDGEPQALTEDYSPARINVRVRDDVVTGVAFMG